MPGLRLAEQSPFTTGGRGRPVQGNRVALHLRHLWAHAGTRQEVAQPFVSQSLMHPPLHIHKHLHCKEKIEALNACHGRHSVAKFWGKCNQQKWDLDRCLREEKAIKRAENFKRSKAEKERLLERLKQGESSTAAS